MDANKTQLVLADERHTQAFAHSLAQVIHQFWQHNPNYPLMIFLCGALGSGKTALVRALLRAFHYTGRVRSPSYTLCESYFLKQAHSTFVIYHFDLYRFSSPLEWQDAGFNELVADSALCLIEWPEKAYPLLPAPDLQLHMQIQEQGRLLEIMHNNSLVSMQIIKSLCTQNSKVKGIAYP